MMRHLPAAAALYFALVFAVGCLLGPIRVFFLEPRLAATLAVLLEAPLLLIAMAASARWVPRKLGMGTSIGLMTATGVAALALVVVADFTLGVWLRGINALEQVGYLATPAGLIYVACLVLFAAMPVLVNRVNGRIWGRP
jgi:hypothetical protein